MPLYAFAESIDKCIGYGDKASGSLTGMIQLFSVDGKNAFCINPNLPEPYFFNESNTFSVGDGAYTDGIIAMFNYYKQSGVGRVTFADALRVYAGYPNVSNNQIMSIVQIGKEASSNKNSPYLPQTSGTIGETVEEVRLSIVEDDKNNNVYTIQVDDSSLIEKLKSINSCKVSDKNLNCSIVSGLDSSGKFKIKVSGKTKASGRKTLTISFGIPAVSSGLIDSITIYECTAGSSCKSQSAWNRCQGGQNQYAGVSASQYQSVVVPGNVGESTGQSPTGTVSISVSGICDDESLSLEEKLNNGCCDLIDESTIKSLEEDSKEEDAYIRNCGPIVVLENSCGHSSCEDTTGEGYFSHSYVRQRSMKYLMEDMDNPNTGNRDSLKKYTIEGPNEYCGEFTTEKVDIYLPTTAVSTSGRFFIFDKYNDENCYDDKTCLRQPYIGDKYKGTAYFDFYGWKARYYELISYENERFTNYKSHDAEYVASKYLVWKTAKNKYDSCVASGFTGYGCYRQGPCVSYDSKNPNKCLSYQKISLQPDLGGDMNTAWSNYQTSITEHDNALETFTWAYLNRIDHQTKRNTCMSYLDGYNLGNYSFDPSMAFSYNQGSTSGININDNKLDMINNLTPVKYWPNTSSTGPSAADYLGKLSAGYSRGIVEKGDNLSFSHSGAQKLVSATESGVQGVAYNFPSECQGNGTGALATDDCILYWYNSTAYNSKQISSTNATDPYGNYKSSVIDNKESISTLNFYRPDENTFALMNSGEYKTLDYSSNDSITNKGIEIGYVYNITLSAYKGNYTTNFLLNNVGNPNNRNRIQDIMDEKIGSDTFSSTCIYCNYEMAFKRDCDECDPTDTSVEFEPQFYYRSISLSDVTPTDREDGETNWSDAKGRAAERAIEAVSGNQIIGNISDNYVALLSNKNETSKSINDDYTYLADSSDIYDDETKEFLEYEITLTTKDMQIIKKNSARSNFSYTTMNMCGEKMDTTKSADGDYCFKCNSQMKECISTFVTAFFDDEKLDNTRKNKWKYYVNGGFCTGSIETCLGGKYPDDVFQKRYLAENKNWP